jgi:hypothetical protein
MRIALERILDRTADIRISTADHGSGDARAYEYDQTFFFRGLRQLHLELTPS